MTSGGEIGGRILAAMAWAGGSIGRRGLLTTVRVVGSTIADAGFDRRYGTETGGVVDSDQFESTLANRAHAVRYRATRARPFGALLRRLRLPAGSTFVDVGSGKGRVLMLASLHPFTRVVGIEFSPAFCEQARRNIAIFQRRIQTKAPIDVCQGDVADHAFTGDENVFYLFNPFDAVILGRLVENLRRSLASHPRRIWLIYNTPLHADVVERSGLFALGETMTVGGIECRVYTHARPERDMAWTVLC